MQTYLPKLELGVLQGPQTSLRPKFGGVPWGFPAELWPQCSQCGDFMPLVAQLSHCEPAIDLGDERNVLHLFQCGSAGLCETWDANSGANAAVILDEAQLNSQQPESPTAQLLNGETCISGWLAFEDGIPSELLPDYLDADAYWKLSTVEWTVARLQRMTKARGIPYWTANGPQEVPSQPYEYLLQIDTNLYVDGPLPSAADAGCQVRLNHSSGKATISDPPDGSQKPGSPNFLQQDEGSEGYYVDWVNFGSDGTAYVFIDRTVTPPKVLWCWNR
jgi:hypothetical protein